MFGMNLELKLFIREDFDIFKDYYNINSKGFGSTGITFCSGEKQNKKLLKKHKISVIDLEY